MPAPGSRPCVQWSAGPGRPGDRLGQFGRIELPVRNGELPIERNEKQEKSVCDQDAHALFAILIPGGLFSERCLEIDLHAFGPGALAGDGGLAVGLRALGDADVGDILQAGRGTGQADRQQENVMPGLQQVLPAGLPFSIHSISPAHHRRRTCTNLSGSDSYRLSR